MGKLSRGILGGFQGQTGTVYGTFWRLMDLIKAMPRKVKRAATAAQLPVQYKLSIMTAMLSGISEIIKKGFQDTPRPKSPMNAAVAYNIANAITGVYPALTIDFSKFMFSQGKLAKPNAIEVEDGVAAGSIKFSWLASAPGTPNSNLDDTLTFLVYNPDKAEYVVITGVTLRSALSYELLTPGHFSGDTVQCYASTVSKDGKLVSNSVYIGQMVL